MNVRAWSDALTPGLAHKLALAVVSVAAYVLLTWLANDEGPLGRLLGWGDAAVYLTGVVFGALVLVPYLAASTGRIWRGLLLCAASASTYRLAIWIAIDGPFQDNAIAAFALAGASAALVVAIAVVLLAPRAASRRLMILATLAGALGGAAFMLDLPFRWLDELIVGHLSWQLLVCAALHAGFVATRPASLR